MGLLDVDICGPSVPKMLGLEGQEIHQSASGWSPVYVDVPEGALGVMSIGAPPDTPRACITVPQLVLVICQRFVLIPCP